MKRNTYHVQGKQICSNTLREEFSDKDFAHFAPLAHFDTHFSEKEKKSNFGDRAKICEIKFRENFFH